MDKGREHDYELLAVKTVVKWCREQGVKIFISDFDYSHVIRLDGTQKPFYTSITSFADTTGEKVNIYISYAGRWERQLKEKKDNFLNYLNARVTKNNVEFHFTYKELDFIRLSESSVSGGADSDDNKIQKVIAKITKLLALADIEKNPSENEAISASLKVQKLLAEYNLSLEQVTGETREEEPIEQVIADVGSGSSKFNWKHSLAGAVADGYACKSFSLGKLSVVFYGYKADVLLARRVFVYLFNVGNKLGNQYVLQHSSGLSDYTLYQSFTLGFVRGVHTQLQKQCTALALVVQPEVEEAWQEFSKDFKNRQSKKKRIESDAYSEGIVEGKRAMNAQYIEE